MARKLASNVRFAAAALVAMIAAVVIALTAAAGQDEFRRERTPAAGLGPEQQLDGSHAQVLKRRYVECERAAGDGTLDHAAVLSCSVVYEELKQRVFGGSLDALHAWWRRMPERAAR